MNPPSEARKLLRAHRYGALCTLSKKFDGHPFGSITPYIVDHDGSLLILISAIAEHTKNILADPRVSLITHNQANPQIQTQGRVTVLGTAAHVADRDGTGKRYLRYFPEAKTYFAMHDFQFYRIVPQAIRHIGGFGNIHWVDAADYAVPPHALTGQEDGLIARMDTEYRDALLACCRLVHQRDASEVGMAGVDCDGFDVRADGTLLRCEFSEPAWDEQQAQAALEKMTQTTPAPAPAP